MHLALLVVLAHGGSSTHRDQLLVVEQPYIRAVARKYARWCADDAAATANLEALEGFKTFRLAPDVEPVTAWRKWIYIVTKNAACSHSIRLSRGSAQSTDHADRAISNYADPSCRDDGPAYDILRVAAFQVMPLGARIGWTAREVREPAKSVAKKMNVGVRGAHYHIQLGSLVVRLMAEAGK